MNRALIDTDILSYYFKGDAKVVANFQKYLAKYEIIEISLITYYEIMSGLLYKNALKQLEIFIDLRIEPHPFLVSDFNPSNPVVNEIINYGIVINYVA